MTNIKALYHGKTLSDLLKDTSEVEFIHSLRKYLKEIMLTGVRIEGDVLARTRYLNERTTQLVIEVIELFGEKHPKEVLSLLGEQEYTLRMNLCEQYNVFEYVANHIKEVKELDAEEVYSLLHATLDENALAIFGKRIFSGWGVKGRELYGFFNELLLKDIYLQHSMGFRFELKVQVYSYHMIEIGRSIGISEKTLQALKEADERTQFMVFPKCRRNALSSPPKKNEVRKITYTQEDEITFKKCLDAYTAELHEIISKVYPSFKVKMDDFLACRGDVDTKYYVSIEKDMLVTNGYESIRAEFIGIVQDFNKIEEQFFGFEHMEELTAKYQQERIVPKEPLFDTL